MRYLTYLLMLALFATPAMAQVGNVVIKDYNSGNQADVDTNHALKVVFDAAALAGVAIASTTSGQTGFLSMCATTTAAPSYTTAKTNPISCTITGGIRVDASGTPPTGQLTAANSDSVVLASDQVGAAIDSAFAGAMFNQGCKAVAAEQTVVTAGDEVNCVTDLVGKQIVMPYANPEYFVNGTVVTITDTTSTATIASAGGSLRNYVTHCTISNSHATVGTLVQILDGSTVIDTIYAGILGGGMSASYPVPLKGTAATAINIKPVTTGANVVGMCNGYKGL